MPDQIRFSFDNLISALSLSLDLLTAETINHHRRVTLIAAQLAKDLKLSEDEYARIFYAAQLHDVGVVSSNDKLNIMKFDYVDSQPHCERGSSVLQESELLKDLSPIIRHHHEKLDGTGYPDGLKSEEIAPLVRIITIADIYDALTSDRSYRQRLRSKEASQILRQMDKQLDQDIVEIFLETIVFDEESK